MQVIIMSIFILLFFLLLVELLVDLREDLLEALIQFSVFVSEDEYFLFVELDPYRPSSAFLLGLHLADVCQLYLADYFLVALAQLHQVLTSYYCVDCVLELLVDGHQQHCLVEVLCRVEL
jgi:hypothetical protein